MSCDGQHVVQGATPTYIQTSWDCTISCRMQCTMTAQLRMDIPEEPVFPVRPVPPV